MATIKCDFCCGSDAVEWRYPAQSFTAFKVGDIGVSSRGDWAACDVCHRMIGAGARAGLLERSLGRLMADHSWLPLDQARESLRHVHDGFFNHSIGAPWPVGGEA